MDTDDIVAQLTAVGMPEDQARLYVETVRLGPSKARAISDSCGFSRSKTYRLLDDMTEKGIVTATVTKPQVFRPAPPDEVLAMLRSRWERGVERVDTVRDRVADPLDELWGTRESGDAPSWTVVDGRRDILDRMADLYESAEQSAHVMSTHEMCMTFTPPVQDCWSAALDAVGRGADFRAVLTCDADARETILDLTADIDADIRTMDPGYLVHFLVVDGERALMYLDQDPQLDPDSGEDVAIISDTRGLVDSLTMFFEMCWRQAQPIRGYDQVRA